MPFQDFGETANCLDLQRLFKQCVECLQIIQTIQKCQEDTLQVKKIGFRHHPSVLMWYHHTNALKLYFNTMFEKVLTYQVHHINKMTKFTNFDSQNVEMPWFVSYLPHLYSHRARLYQKDYNYYKDKFEFPQEYLNFGYIWTHRHSKEYYYEHQENPKILADNLEIRYQEKRYCQGAFKSGKKCTKLLRVDQIDYCGVHFGEYIRKSQSQIKTKECSIMSFFPSRSYLLQ